MKSRFHRQSILAMAWSVALFAGAVNLRAQGQPVDRAKSLLAAQLVDDARSAGRNLQLPPALAARESLVLLQKAQELDPASATVLRLLAEAAGALHRTAIERAALLKLVNLQSDNLAAQLKFLDSLAAGAQTVAQRIHIYRKTMEQKSLNPQLKSALALRIGQLLNAQAHHHAANLMFVDAVKLNSANLAAWQELTLALQKNDAPASQLLYCYLHTLHCDPFQPDAMVGIAHLLAAAGHYALAAKWANAAIAEYQQSRTPLGANLPSDLAAYWAISAQQDKVRPYLDELLAFKKPATSVLLVALAEYSGGKPSADTRPAKLLSRIEARLSAGLKSRPGSLRLQADALWLQLVYQDKLPADIAVHVASMQKPLAADPALYARLRGWQLLRQGNVQAAVEKFQTGLTDPYAVIGLAQAKAALGHKKAATALLLGLWRKSPPLPAAFATAQTARNLGIHLSSDAAGNALAVLARLYPSRMLHAMYDPSNIVLVSVHWPHRFPNYGRPVYIHVHYYNESPWSLAVGPNTAITTDLAMAARIQGISNINLGAYAIDSNASALRLDSQQSMEVTYQIDQGTLRTISLDNPDSLVGGRLEVITNPLADGTDIYPGLGGQTIDAGYFNIHGFFSGGLTAMTAQTAHFNGLSSADQMIAAGAIANVLPKLAADLVSANKASATGSPSPAEISKAIIALGAPLESELNNPGATDVQAWLARLAPRKQLPGKIQTGISALRTSKSAVVRMMSYWRMLVTAQDKNTLEARRAVQKELSDIAHADKDPLAARWAADLAEQAGIAPVAGAKKSHAAAKTKAS